ncbi:uncharacterized protein PG998_002704 [Apiospora kogelbergensis]|uniref:uncharacterized protein n=1 Tax=Apiospora kogelbergensis TaxID=1337665 RepID=UPI0031325D55
MAVRFFSFAEIDYRPRREIGSSSKCMRTLREAMPMFLVIDARFFVMLSAQHEAVTFGQLARGGKTQAT